MECRDIVFEIDPDAQKREVAVELPSPEIHISPVKSVNGKTGHVVLTTSDLENTSDYQNSEEVAAAIEQAIEAEAERADQALEQHAEDTDLHTSAEEKAAWNAKYNKPTSGIPKTDLSADVQGSLDKADSALQEHQSLAEYRKAADQDRIDNNKVDKVEGSSLVPDAKVTAYDAHLLNNDNPHSVTKAQVGLSNVDNTSDINKPISNAQQIALTNLQTQIDALVSKSDVVDVVATYADLLSYDTSKLLTNDVVKVLDDSTHSNSRSYYRWVITEDVGAWEYIGSEAVGYTKAEADGRFVQQEEGKGLSDNNYSDEEKQKVADNTTARHTHANKTILDNISEEDIEDWNAKGTPDNITIEKNVSDQLQLKDGGITIEKINTLLKATSVGATPSDNKFITESAVANYIASGNNGDPKSLNNINLNTITATGFYFCFGCTNRPGDCNGVMIATRRAAHPEIAVQLYFTFVTREVYVRNCDSGTWSDWRKLVTSADISTYLTDYRAAADQDIIDESKVDKVSGSSLVPDSKVSAYDSHIADTTSNPHSVTKAQVGLGNVDNTSDANKPISTAQQIALTNLQTQIDALVSKSDVVDVVGTYAELVAYDTSTLLNNDVVKVLSDSTHDNSRSYYRWVIVSDIGSWDYIGSEAVGYTKGEADAKFVEKVSGKGLSTNDYDATEKGKVADNTTARHTHSNKALLDTYTQTETDLSDAVDKKHSHSNKTVLDGISAYLKNASVSQDGTTLTLTKHDDSTVQFQGGGGADIPLSVVSGKLCITYEV